MTKYPINIIVDILLTLAAVCAGIMLLNCKERYDIDLMEKSLYCFWSFCYVRFYIRIAGMCNKTSSVIVSAIIISAIFILQLFFYNNLLKALCYNSQLGASGCEKVPYSYFLGYDLQYNLGGAIFRYPAVFLAQTVLCFLSLVFLKHKNKIYSTVRNAWHKATVLFFGETDDAGNENRHPKSMPDISDKLEDSTDRYPH